MLKLSGIPREFNPTESGFTLVELMVTLVIFSFVMVLLFFSFNSFISTGQSIARGIDHNERARDTFRRVIDDLTCMYVPESGTTRVENSAGDQDSGPFQMTGSETHMDGRTFSTLEFASLSGVQTGRSRPSGVVGITYYVRKNSQGLFDLCRSEQPIGSDRDTDPCTDPVLAGNITGFTIDFIDIRHDEHREWSGGQGGDGGTIPAALNIGLTLKSENKEKIYETAVVLPVQEQTSE